MTTDRLSQPPTPLRNQESPMTGRLPLRLGLSHEIHRSEGVGPHMQARIAGFINKTSRLN